MNNKKTTPFDFGSSRPVADRMALIEKAQGVERCFGLFRALMAASEAEVKMPSDAECCDALDQDFARKCDEEL